MISLGRSSRGRALEALGEAAATAEKRLEKSLGKLHAPQNPPLLEKQRPDGLLRNQSHKVLSATRPKFSRLNQASPLSDFQKFLAKARKLARPLPDSPSPDSTNSAADNPSSIYLPEHLRR